MATLFGIYYVDPTTGEKQLCEVEGGTYYERAFALESDAIAYIKKHYVKIYGPNYITAPLPADIIVATYDDSPVVIFSDLYQI